VLQELEGFTFATSLDLNMGYYRLGLAHFVTFETLFVKFQALLQIQRLLLIPTCFAFSRPVITSNVSSSTKANA
jgi:hypothetical protein